MGKLGHDMDGVFQIMDGVASISRVGAGESQYSRAYGHGGISRQRMRDNLRGRGDRGQGGVKQQSGITRFARPSALIPFAT